MRSEYLADVTLDRVGRKIEQGLQIQNLLAFAFGVASMIYREYLNEREKFRRAAEEMNYRFSRMEHFITATGRNCQEICVRQLEPAEHELLVDYYITAIKRESLADARGVSLNTLRSQIHRLKAKLKACVDKCRQVA